MSARALRLAADPVVPGRDALLDAGGMRRHFRRVFPSMGLGSVAIRRVKYRVGESLRVLYAIETAGGTALVSARTRQAGASQPLAARTPSDAEGTFPPDFEDEALGARFCTFPHDRRLGCFQRLLDPAPELAEIMNGRWVASRVAGYAPEKAVIVACLDAAGAVIGYAKLHALEADAAAAAAIQHALAGAVASSGIRIPRVLHRDPAAPIVVSEAAAGVRLADIGAAGAADAVHRLGAGIGALHQVPPPSVLASRRYPSALRVRQAADLAGAVDPRVLSGARLLAERLLGAAPDAEPGAREAVVLHGDVHLKNAVLDGDRLWLIDFDQAAAGPAAADLGSFIGLLRSRAVADLLRRRTALELERRFLEGYASVRPLPPPAAIAWHAAAALLQERVVRAISRMRRPLLANLAGLIDEAGNLLSKGLDS